MILQGLYNNYLLTCNTPVYKSEKREIRKKGLGEKGKKKKRLSE